MMEALITVSGCVVVMTGSLTLATLIGAAFVWCAARLCIYVLHHITKDPRAVYWAYQWKRAGCPKDDGRSGFLDGPDSSSEETP